MEVSKAVKQLKNFKVEYSGSGEKVTYQNPEPNSEIYEGETIRLMLN